MNSVPSWAWGIGLSAGLMAAGCSTPPTAAPGAAGVQARPCGTVIRPRSHEGWVVLECPLSPAAGSEVDLVRDGVAVARVRITAHRRGSYVVAEIVNGRPQAGDVIDERRQRPEERP
jgi:hypothetical protein